MSKHAAATLVLDRQPAPPKHSTGWTLRTEAYDRLTTDILGWPHIPGKHAKPFGKHHPATPVTEATTANVTPLKKRRTQAPTGCRICDDLDAAA